ncbi:precorrin-6y C5,15-methyltransferase (decarboxylating) subunit CbiE [Nanoarchaeota archaeon]|nr:MAG: precorrin-6y C5,15-methyltransferase (decarboxylating) subunit CbiE [Nanoarchaeota archaeon]
MEMGAYGDEAREIVRKSYSIMNGFVKGDDPEALILKRCIMATGDPSIKDVIVFKGNPIETGIEALRSKQKIIVDVSMVRAGIRRYYNVLVAVEHANVNAGVRVRDGFYRLRDAIDGSIVAIGNSPSGAMAVYELCKRGYKPSLIIATPVGFVNANESKELIRKLELPSITTMGSKGGSNLCVAILNGIIDMAYKKGFLRSEKGVIIVGVGASKGYLTERAIEEIQKADIVYGSKRALEIAKKYIKSNFVEIKRFSRDVYKAMEEEGKRRRVVVLSTGDPMVIGLGKKIKGDVIPGVSSVQLAMANLGVDLTEVMVIDGHAKGCIEEVKKAFEIGRDALILADSKFNPEILRTFADVTVLENLGYEGERICKDCEIESDLVILFAKKR